VICNFTPPRLIPYDLATRAKLLGLSLERAKFLTACPHRENAKFKGDGQVIVVPFDPDVQINEAKRLGIGALDAAEMFNRPVAEFIVRGFPMKSTQPRAASNAGYSLLQYEASQGAWKIYKGKKVKPQRPI